MQVTQTLDIVNHASPIGEILSISRAGVLYHLDFADCSDRINTILRARFNQYELRRQSSSFLGRVLARYFAGDVGCFADLKLHTDGTLFQQTVWHALQQIPYGQSWSYTQLAQAIGQPKAARAVASANSQNPVSIIIPCHRVIGNDGSLRGYAGGVSRKRWLLQHENAEPLSNN